MKPDILLAKGYDAEKGDFNDAEKTRRLSLTFHSQTVYEAAREIFDATADAQLTALGLSPEEYRDRFRRILLAAAALHDLGKANSLFQRAVRGDDCGQSLRHEWILYFLLRFTKLGEFVRRAFPEETRDRDFHYLVWAVAAHHLKEAGEEVSPTGGVDGELALDRPEVREILRRFAETFDVQTPPDESAFDFLKSLGDAVLPLDVCPKTLPSRLRSLDKFLAQSSDGLRRVVTKICQKAEDKASSKLPQFCAAEEFENEIAFAAAVRSSLLAADVAASAAFDLKNGFNSEEIRAGSFQNWFKQTLGKLATPEQIQKNVESQATQIKEKRNDKRDATILRQIDDFQTRVAASTSRVTLCVAGCGSGKTRAAWRWIRAVCRPEGVRVFFCYPTTGTAAEGCVSSLVAFEGDEAVLRGALATSRAEVDFELDARLRCAKEATVAKENKTRSKEEQKAIERAEAIMETLNRWALPIVDCTVDVALGFLAGYYSGRLLWPALSQGVFVFDEIHSYDETLFTYLLNFIKIVRGAKILLMTASLPEKRLQRLQECLKVQNDELNVIEGPRDWENVKRYYREPTQADLLSVVVERFRRKQKILWVCNTVDRAIKAAQDLQAELQKNPKLNFNGKLIVYHSRFRYKDRVERRRACVEAFNGSEAAICVATQVAEMSLDLDADFLVSDWAPIPALIQRLGRLNRRATNDGAPRPFWLVEPLDKNGVFCSAPYKNGKRAAWRDETARWLDALGTSPVSQRDLAERWRECADEEASSNVAETIVPWLATGPWSCEGSLRDPNQNCDVIYFERPEDRPKNKRGENRPLTAKERVCWAIPMQYRALSAPVDKLGAYLIIGSEEAKRLDFQYDAVFGGRWAPNDVQDSEDVSTPEGVKGY